MIFIEVLGICLFLFLAGFVFLNELLPKKTANGFLLLGGGYALSLLLVVAQTFLFSIFNIPITRLSILLPWIFILLVTFHFWKKTFRFPSFTLPKNITDLFILFAIISLVLFVFLEGILRLPMGWDALATWLLMGKAFYYGGGLMQAIYHYAQIDSPPAIGLLLMNFYTLIGKVDDHAILLFFSSIYLALLLVLFGAVKSFSNNTRLALLTVLLFATLQPAIRQAGRFEAGYADLLVGYFFLTAASFTMIYHKTNRAIYFIIAGLFAGASSFIKNEGSAFFLIFLITSASMQFRSRRWNILYFFPGILYFASWQLYKHFYQLNSSYYDQSHFVFDRLGLVGRQMFLEFLRIDRWNFLWLGLVLSVIFFPKKIILFVPFQLFLLQIAVYFFIYMITPLDPVGHIIGSFDRLLLQVAPLAVLSIAYCTYAILKSSPFLGTPRAN